MDLLLPVCSAHDGMADIDELNTRSGRFDSALGYIANRNLRSSAAGFANKLEAIIPHDIPAKSIRAIPLPIFRGTPSPDKRDFRMLDFTNQLTGRLSRDRANMSKRGASHSWHVSKRHPKIAQAFKPGNALT